LVSNDLGDLEEMVTGDSIVIVANEGGKPYDVDAVHIALTRGARFVGLLASQRRGAYTIAELIRRNVPLDLIRQRLHTPVGIDIGGRTAEEVSLSILAQVVMTIRRGTGRLMSEVKDPYEFLNDALEGKISPHCSWSPSTMA
jgi:xanthine dehydrogenase accessory factor